MYYFQEDFLRAQSALVVSPPAIIRMHTPQPASLSAPRVNTERPKTATAILPPKGWHWTVTHQPEHRAKAVQKVQESPERMQTPMRVNLQCQVQVSRIPVYALPIAVPPVSLNAALPVNIQYAGPVAKLLSRLSHDLHWTWGGISKKVMNNPPLLTAVYTTPGENVRTVLQQINAQLPAGDVLHVLVTTHHIMMCIDRSQ